MPSYRKLREPPNPDEYPPEPPPSRTRADDDDYSEFIWPDVYPLTAEDFCPYVEPKRGKRSVWEWISHFFPVRGEPGTPQADYPPGRLQAMFNHALHKVIQERVDSRDRGNITFCDVPSPTQPYTKASYGPAEVSVWWRAALRQVGYEIEEDDE